jgi:uncharacterized protein involved in exopolysaccharide biosynthesis
MEPIATNDEISLKEILIYLEEIKRLILRKKYWVVGIAFAGASIGLVAAFLIKPTYTATLSFAMQDSQSSSMSGIASVASQFGLSLGGGSNSAFGGDNLYELFTSKHLIENTLLQPTQINGQTSNLLNLYIDTYHLRKSWTKSKNPEIRAMQFPLNQQPATFTRAQDSILETIYTTIIKKPMLTAKNRDKKLSIGDITFISENEVLSQLFVENLIKEAADFYVETKTKVARQNYDSLKYQADSVKAVYDNAVAARASMADNVPNAVRQSASVGVIRKATDMQIAVSTYMAMNQNLEVLKMSIDQDTPLVQVIDRPILPLEKNKLGKLKGLILGGFIGGFLAVLALIAFYFFEKLKKDLLAKTAEPEHRKL